MIIISLFTSLVIVRICIDTFLYHCFTTETIFATLKNILTRNSNLNADVTSCKNSAFELPFLRRRKFAILKNL